MIVEIRLDGSLAIRFGGHYLNDRELESERPGGLCPQTPGAYRRVGRRSGCTPAEPCPSDGEEENTHKAKTSGRKAALAKRLQKRKGDDVLILDISIVV